MYQKKKAKGLQKIKASNNFVEVCTVSMYRITPGINIYMRCSFSSWYQGGDFSLTPSVIFLYLYIKTDALVVPDSKNSFELLLKNSRERTIAQIFNHMYLQVRQWSTNTDHFGFLLNLVLIRITYAKFLYLMSLSPNSSQLEIVCLQNKSKPHSYHLKIWRLS